MNFFLSRRSFGALLCSWNTTAIFSRESQVDTLLVPRISRRILNRDVFIVFGLCILPAAAHAQEVAYLKHPVDADFLGAHAIKLHDIDDDGDLDILGAGLTVDSITWWENTSGDGSAWTPHTISESFKGARFVDAADLDGDNDLDLFGAAASDDLVTWWENDAGDGSTWTEHPVDNDFDFAIHLHAADLDNDNDLDLIGAALKGDAIHWWENAAGDGSVWTEHIVNDTFDGARHVCSVDIDGDGDLDILGTADMANEVTWWENTGGDASSWVAHVVEENFLSANSVHPIDVDGDQDADLVGAADAADDVMIWINVDGDGLTWDRIPIDENFDGAFTAIPVDMDGDGDMDVLGAASEANKMTWWENMNGEGNSWKDHLIDDEFIFPMTINAADIDLDGDMDIFGGSYHGEVVWWETTIIDDPPLPVELTAFDAVIDEGRVLLQWETASELNNAGFEVQHWRVGSLYEDVHPWSQLAFVEGAGTTDGNKQYRYESDLLLPGNHKFRLKQIDFDGTFTFSPTVEVIIAMGANERMSALYPNPFNPQAQFFLTLSQREEVQIDVYNALGQKVERLYSGQLDGGQLHTFGFDAAHLPGGLYLINATGESFTTTQAAMLVK